MKRCRRPIGRRLARSATAARAMAPLFRRGRHVNTAKLAGFIALYALAALRRWRRGTLRYRIEQERIDAWLARIRDRAARTTILRWKSPNVSGWSRDTATPTSAAGEISPISCGTSMPAARRADLAARVRRLRAAALADEDGRELDSALKEFAAAA